MIQTGRVAVSNKNDTTPIWDILRIEEYFASDFPQVARGKSLYVTEDVTTQISRVRLMYDASNLRPGGTIQGPALMALADIGAYVVLLGAFGEAATGAMTTSLQMDFLRKPPPGDVIAVTELVKPGKTLSVCHVRITGAEDGEVLAVSSCTYALPRAR